jgi:predicted lactoylglutathione lyase
MIKELWLNLPVKNLEKAKTFYTALGFAPSENGNSDFSAAFTIGSKKIVLMLFEQSMFEQVAQCRSSDTGKGSEMLISIDTESREETDQLAETVKKAGGLIFSEPQEVQGWMYGFGFCDLDGHRWNALYMDFSKLNVN